MKTLNLNTATNIEILSAAKEDAELMKYLGGEQTILIRDVESLRSIIEMYFALNNEVSCYFDKNGF